VGTPDNNSTEVLRAEILADARRACEGIIRGARQESEALRAKATAQAGQIQRERLELASAEASRRREVTLATVPVEAGRMRAARIEEMLQSVHDEVRRRLLAREGFDWREVVLTLAAEAVKQMPGNSFAVTLAAADRAAFGDGLVDQIVRRAGRPDLSITISQAPEAKGGVLLLQDAEGRVRWDNNLAARLQRLWPELRRQVAVRAALVAERRPSGGGA
jgi:vacuolar-type H+-ATPase subunit E/Vma4